MSRLRPFAPSAGLTAMAAALATLALTAPAAQAHRVRHGGGWRLVGGVHLGGTVHVARPVYPTYVVYHETTAPPPPAPEHEPDPWTAPEPAPQAEGPAPELAPNTSAHAAPPPAPAYPAPAYAPPPVPEDATTVARARDRAPVFGLGLRASSLQFAQDARAQGAGIVTRLRLGGADLTLELGRERFVETERADTRLGVGLQLPLTAGAFTPYILVGVGASRAELGDSVRSAQGYIEGGGGLELWFGRRLSFAGDVRYTARHRVERDEDSRETVTPRPHAVDEREDNLEARLSAIVHF